MRTLPPPQTYIDDLLEGAMHACSMAAGAPCPNGLHGGDAFSRAGCSKDEMQDATQHARCNPHPAVPGSASGMRKWTQADHGTTQAASQLLLQQAQQQAGRGTA